MVWDLAASRRCTVSNRSNTRSCSANLRPDVSITANASISFSRESNASAIMAECYWGTTTIAPPKAELWIASSLGISPKPEKVNVR